MLTMYPGMVNSPITELAAAIDETQTTIEVIDGTKLPDAPNLAIIGLGEDAETILYTEKTGNVLSGVTRGFQGVAKAWGQGARIARFFTEYDQRAMMQNIQENADNLAAHLNETVTQAGGVHGLQVEEGTWTPFIRGDIVVGSNTYTTQTGRYYKVGKLVTVHFFVTMSTKDPNMSGNVGIGGLPFIVSQYFTCSLRYSNITLPTGRTQLVGTSFPNSAIIHLNAEGSDTTWQTLTETNVKNNTQVVGSLTYFTA